ncbi:hypothetical protein MLD38_003531 [Melastoma candidum]|uniref:Uncharacterized protein n=1 Tax=Melastoma candidum TaxID=119954 RepID=A0ACB9S2C7_9MYRT|nr:hypothetical protein MLD38_003531 [Melastoma candidum]
MQTPKGRPSLEVPQRVSPRAARKLKTALPESDSAAALSQAVRTPRERSPKVAERRSPRSPASLEKKRPSRISELESQILQLQGELKKAKDEISSSEAWKNQAEQDAEESTKQISGLSAKLEEAQEQISCLSSEESRASEIERISQEKEQAWRAELEAVKKQHSFDSSALASSVNEILRLKNELEMVAESEAALKEQAQSVGLELESLKGNLAETQLLMDNMKTELKDSRESEAQARALVNDTLIQLESAKATVEVLRLEGIKATESYNSIASELKQSRARVSALEGIVSKLEADLSNTTNKVIAAPLADVNGDESEARTQNTHETDKLKEEVEYLKLEVEKLRSALILAEAKDNDADNGGKEQLKDANEMIEKMKNESSRREAELVTEIDKAKATIEDLKAHLMDKETELQGIREENDGLNVKLQENVTTLEEEAAAKKDIEKLREELSELKANMMDKETELQHISEENETMKLEIKKREEIVAELESARNAEKDTHTKLNLVLEEVEKSNRRAARVTEQLQASQASAAEMESELRRLKVQSDQWRKAAEAAAAIIPVGGNGKYMDRTTSMDGGYMTGKMGSPYADDMDDDDLIKKKNGNVLKKIGVLWRKPQK